MDEADDGQSMQMQQDLELVNHEFYQACCKGDLLLVQKILKEGVAINWKNPKKVIIGHSVCNLASRLDKGMTSLYIFICLSMPTEYES